MYVTLIKEIPIASLLIFPLRDRHTPLINWDKKAGCKMLVVAAALLLLGDIKSSTKQSIPS